MFLLALDFETCSTVAISFARVVQRGSSSMKWNIYGAVILLGLISGTRGASGPIGRPFLPPLPPEVIYVLSLFLVEGFEESFTALQLYS